MITGVSFCDMNDKQKSTAINGILFKIAIIAGCPLPTDERHIKTLEIEILKFMSENEPFANVTFEEVLTAFRFNAAGKFDEKVKHYQNMFNLDYLGEVLSKWVVLKRNIKDKAEKELLRKNLFDVTELLAVSKDQQIQNSKFEWERTKDFMFIKANVYDILKAMGKLEIDQENKKRINVMARVKMDLIYKACTELQWYNFDQHKIFIGIISKKISVSEYFDSGPESAKKYQKVPELTD